MTTDSLEKVPFEYMDTVLQTLENDVQIQAGRGNELPPMTELMRMSTLAYQMARNKDASSRIKKDKPNSGQNEME